MQAATGFRRDLRQGVLQGTAHCSKKKGLRWLSCTTSTPTPAGRRWKLGSPAGAQKLTCSFAHGICLLGGKADVGHFPSRGKHNNTRKHQARWECSKPGAAAPSRAQTKGRAGPEARPARPRHKVWEPVCSVPSALL